MSKNIFIAPEQYDLQMLLTKFPAKQDIVLSSLAILAFEDYAKELWDSNWSVNTQNPNNWSLYATIEAYREVIKNILGSNKPEDMLAVAKGITYDLDAHFEKHLTATRNRTTELLSLFYDGIEITTANIKLPSFYVGKESVNILNTPQKYIDIPQQYYNSDSSSYYYSYTGKIGNAYTQQHTRITDSYLEPPQNSPFPIRGLLGAWVLYRLLPTEIKINLHPQTTWFGDFQNFPLRIVLDNLTPLIYAWALKRFTYFHLKSQQRYMTFNEKYINPDQLSDVTLAGDTIYYCILKDAPLTGLKNADDSDMIVQNPQFQQTVDFWSKLFAAELFGPLLQGAAALYPVGIKLAYDIPSSAAYNTVTGNIERKSSIFTQTTTIKYAFNSFMNDFIIQIDDHRRIFVLYNRDITKEDITIIRTKSTMIGTLIIIAAVALAIAGGIALLGPATAGGGAAGGAAAALVPTELVAGGAAAGSGTFAAIGTAITGALSAIVTALPVLAPILGIFGIKPKKPGSGGFAPINNTCPTGYVLQNGQCVQDTNTGTQLAGMFTVTNLALMAGGGLILGLIFMNDDDNKAYRAAKKIPEKAEESEETKKNRPKKRYNKRRH